MSAYRPRADMLRVDINVPEADGGPSEKKGG